MNPDAYRSVTCAIRQRYTPQRITGVPWVGHNQGGFEIWKAFDGKDGTGWGFHPHPTKGEVTLSIDLATVAYIELLFNYDNRHIWEEFEVHMLHDGEWDRDMDMTINMDNVVKRCGPRFRIIKDKEGNPKKGAIYKLAHVDGPVHRVEAIYFKVWDTFRDPGGYGGNAVLSEVTVYGTKAGQFASTTRDHMGRYLMATPQDNMLMAAHSVSSSPPAQFEMEPLPGGFFAWRNINKLYMACNTDGTLKFSKKTSDEAGVKITIEEQPDYSVTDNQAIIDPAKATSGGANTAVGSSEMPFPTISQPDPKKSCHPTGLQYYVKRTHGWAIAGYNEGGCHAITWEECFERCNKDTNCRSFDKYVKGHKKCCISHQTMDTVPGANQKRNMPQLTYNEMLLRKEKSTLTYDEMMLALKPNQTERKSKKVAFKTESGNYIRVDPEGHLTCSSIILDDNSIFDLIRPIETGVVNNLFVEY